MSLSTTAGAGLEVKGPLLTARIPVVDTDSHITEPARVWEDRLPSKWAEIMPRVRRSGGGRDMWVIGDRVISAAWASAPAGFRDYWPAHPRTIDEVDPAAYDAHARTKHLDRAGISSQILYPNVLSFNVQDILRFGDAEFHLACVRAYNDFLSDFARASPGRFIPIMFLPIWDVAACVKEIERSGAAGHKGILFSNTPEVIGLPPMRDAHWAPVFEAAQANGLPINFHIGFGKHGDEEVRRKRSRRSRGDGETGEAARKKAIEFRTGEVIKVVDMMSQARGIGEVIVSGLCERYPKLDFVSVESGFGYIPYYLDGLDWQWMNSGSAEILPEWLMPSEYFKRQIYATFWFEHRTVLRMADLFADNLMFESDFPHPTCIAPGPKSFTDSPNKVIQANLASLPEPLLRKLLYQNAARVYRLDESYMKLVPAEKQAA